jgi:hypothetical protein
VNPGATEQYKAALDISGNLRFFAGVQLRRAAAIVLSLLVAAAALATLEFVRLPQHTYLWREIQNTGHVPLFGVISLAMLALSVELLRNVVKKRFVHYVIAAGVTFCIGLITELAQIIGPRDADFWDQVRNTVGIVIFLGAYLIFDRKMREPLQGLGRRTIPLIMGVVAVLIVVVLVPVTLWVDAYAFRNEQFPVICNFSSRRELKFIRTHHATVRRISAPRGWSTANGGDVGEVTFKPPVEYPGFIIDDPFEDWSGYSALTFDTYSELDTVITLHMTIEDNVHNQMYSDRFNYSFKVAPGPNRITVPLDIVREAPAGRSMDMSRIANINIFAYRPTVPFVVYFDRFVLE